MTLLVLKEVYKTMNKKFLLTTCIIAGILAFIVNDIIYYTGKVDQTFPEHIIIASIIIITTVNTLFLYWKN